MIIHQKDRKFTECTYDDVGRIYNFECGTHYHSVTTALGYTADKSFLERWRERIGNEEADRQVAKAQNYGEAFHYCGEMYLKKVARDRQHAFVEMMWRKMQQKMNGRVTAVHSVEGVLYSDIIRLAGRTDAVIDWDNVLTVFDYKLVNYWIPEFLHDYWIQATIYAHMWEYLTGQRPKKLVLGVGNKKQMKAKTFENDPNKFAKEAVERIQAFHQKIAI